jgi:pyridoxal phosphate enzyme (YggS family)
MDDPMYQHIRDRFELVTQKMESAALSVGRESDDIKLMVVTKAQSLEVVQAVISAGARILGENYVEEAIPKINAINDKKIEWHMIGHIQSRKTKQVSEFFSWVHSLDRRKVARRLNNFANQIDKRIPVLLECNVSGEESKFGYPVWKSEQWSEFVEEVNFITDLPNLEVKGLMTMPPWDPDPDSSRPYYVYLRRLRDYLSNKFPDVSWLELSMGMSNDYEVAIQEGATIVRVGTAILGSRTT